RFQSEVAREHEPEDLARALADLEDLGVAEVARHRELLGVAIATVDLDGLARADVGDVARAQLRAGGCRRVVATLVLQPGGVPREQTSGLDRDPHVGELERDGLVRADRAAESLPIARVREARVQTRLREPHRDRRDRDPAVVQRAEALAEPPAPPAEPVFVRYPSLR